MKSSIKEASDNVKEPASGIGSYSINSGSQFINNRPDSAKLITLQKKVDKSIQSGSTTIKKQSSHQNNGKDLFKSGLEHLTSLPIAQLKTDHDLIPEPLISDEQRSTILFKRVEEPFVSTPMDMTVQMKIGSGGDSNVGRLTKMKGIKVVGDIVSAGKESGLISRTKAEEDKKWLYKVERSDKAKGYVHEDDDSYDLVDGKEEQTARTNANEVSPLIMLRGTDVQHPDSGEYKLNKEDGTINREDGEYAFIIDKDLKLKIGSAEHSGHTGLSNAESVYMAGVIKVVKGKASYHLRKSGHYWPSEVQEETGLEVLKGFYKWISDPTPKGFVEGIGQLRGLAAFAAATNMVFADDEESVTSSDDDSDDKKEEPVKSKKDGSTGKAPDWMIESHKFWTKDRNIE